MKYILASGSPRRKELVTQVLEKHKKEFEIVTSKIEEKIQSNNPEEVVVNIALQKAKDVFKRLYSNCEEFVVIGGDTIVYFEGEFLGKPKNSEHATKMLDKMQGKKNEIYTGLAVIIKRKNSVVEETRVTKAEVWMKYMSKQDIQEYVDTLEPLDKAGAYAIQGIGEKYIDYYFGNRNAGIGLDTEKLEEILKKYKLL